MSLVCGKDRAACESVCPKAGWESWQRETYACAVRSPVLERGLVVLRAYSCPTNECVAQSIEVEQH